MPDFTLRSDSVKVEQIMDQIRARIREKRGVDYTEQQLRELAAVKLEKFLDPRGVRSDLLEQFRQARPPYAPPELPNYAFEDQTLFDSHRGALRVIRRLLRPLLKLFFNPNPLIQALHIQSQLNAMNADREAKRESARHQFDQLHYEMMHNLVVETTRMGIEIKNLKMRVESLTSRLEFNERRARALERVVVYAPATDRLSEVQPASETADEASTSVQEAGAAPVEGPGQRSRRRRRRRGRRGSGSAASIMGGARELDAPAPEQLTAVETGNQPAPGTPEAASVPAAGDAFVAEQMEQSRSPSSAEPHGPERDAGEPDDEQ